MLPKRPTDIRSAVDQLFDKEPLPPDLARHLLSAWSSNLNATERSVSRGFLAIVATFAGFITLDTKILTKIAFQGAEIGRTGIILCFATGAMSYFYYRCITQLGFAHDLRTAIAVLYRRLHEPVYIGGLDLLTHVPSIRNLEAYDSFYAPKSLRVFHERTTDVVTLALLLGPLVVVVYCTIRLWSYPDVRPVLWTVTVLAALVFVLRAWLYGLRQKGDDVFADRRLESLSDSPKGAGANAAEHDDEAVAPKS
ncbi:MAG: hypothetical protein V1907_01270 [Candidatus Kerfeldbacteria bacterium]